MSERGTHTKYIPSHPTVEYNPLLENTIVNTTQQEERKNIYILSIKDIEAALKTGKIASLIGVEGGHTINSNLAILRTFYKLGAR